MPQLNWDEVKFLEFFAVEPTVEDYAVSYDYEIERAGLRLLFTVRQLESVIQASLFRGKAHDALFTFAAYVRGEARLSDDARGKCLDFEDCIIAPNRFWYMESGDPFDRQRFPISVTVRMAVDPDIRMAFVNFETRT